HLDSVSHRPRVLTAPYGTLGQSYPSTAAPPTGPRSFPTRRSSDLCSRPRAARARARAPSPRRAAPRPFCRRRQNGRGAARRGDRSEEHTSELQSRFDLVCRLLLEKKNKRQPTISAPPKSDLPLSRS